MCSYFLTERLLLCPSLPQQSVHDHYKQTFDIFDVSCSTETVPTDSREEKNTAALFESKS